MFLLHAGSTGNDEVYPHLLYLLHHRLGYFGIGDDDVDVFQPADSGETAPAEFAGVSQDDGLLGCLHHDPVQFCFPHISRRDAEIEVDAVHAEEEFAERAAPEDFHAVLPDDRYAAMPDHASELYDVDVVVGGQCHGGAQGC